MAEELAARRGRIDDEAASFEKQPGFRFGLADGRNGEGDHFVDGVANHGDGRWRAKQLAHQLFGRLVALAKQNFFREGRAASATEIRPELI